VPAGGDNKIDRSVVDRFTVSYEEHIRRHEVLLREVTSSALRSPTYSSRIRTISSFDELDSLPLTSYETILDDMEKEGVDKVLLAPPEQYFHTSGSTGKPKRFYYGKEDIQRIASEYAMMAHIIGIKPDQKAWNLGGRLPDVSGYVLIKVGEVLQMEDPISTLLKDDKDLIKALRRISSERGIDIMASAALIIFLIGKMSMEPGYLKGLVEDKIVRTYRFPRPLARMMASIYLRGVDQVALRHITDNVSIAISYAEALNPYMGELAKCYPKLKIYDVYGSTENPIMAAQMEHQISGLSMFISTIIPELAQPEEVIRGKADHSYRVRGVPWFRWKAGMKGELIITRPGQCLPLVRYPTGDIIEVLDPAHQSRIALNGGVEIITLPLIRVLGRSVETLDFEAHDEAGNFLGIKIYSRYVNEALHRSSNVRWWELYNIRDTPARLAMVVIPERDPQDGMRYKNEIVRRLTEERSDIPHTFQVANDLGKLDIIVLAARSYEAIQAEIDRRIREGRSLGQLKPKHIYVMSSEAEFALTMHQKYGA